MKQLLFLLLFPCLVLAQYTGNAGQKITLGEQTTADGLVFRGVASIDTVTETSKITRANKQDTSAFILLDTVTNLLWHYKTASNGWIQAGGSTFDTTTLNLVSRFALKLNIADTSNIKYVNTYGTQTVNGAKTFTSAVTATRFNPTPNTVTGTGLFAPTSTSLGFSISGTNKLTLNSSGNLGLGVSPSAWGAAFKVFQMGATSLYEESAVATKLGNNVYFSDANRYYANSGASSYTQQFGTHLFQVASDGTANNIITFTNAMAITQGGNVGIGTTSPAVQFHTTSNVRFAGLASITDLRTDADGDLFNGSDFNLKNSIDTINFGLSDVLKLKPVSFNWNDEARNINEYKSMGFIAQDIMDVIPNAASTMGDGDMQVDYNAIVATLTKAIQEQQALIKALEQRILILENK